MSMKCEVVGCECVADSECYEIMGDLSACLLSGQEIYGAYERALVYLCSQHFTVLHSGPIMATITFRSPQAMLIARSGSVRSYVIR